MTKRTSVFAKIAAAALIALPMIGACSETKPVEPIGRHAQAVHDGGAGVNLETVGLFEIDGNAHNEGDAAGGDDWSNVLSGAGGDRTHVLVADGSGSATIFTGGGSKDEQPLGNWKWKNGGGLPDKDNITNAYSAAYVDPTTGHLILYFGADRFDNSGDAMFGFWFFRGNVTLQGTNGGDFGGAHQDGDLLVLANFENGGAKNRIEVFKWSGNATTGTLVKVAGADSGVSPFCTPDKTACAATNKDGAITSLAGVTGYSYTSKDGSSDIPVHSFFEGGIDATALAGVTCVSTFLAETRSATSVTATLKDFAAGGLPTCGLTATKVCNAPTLEIVGGGDAGAGMVVPRINFSGQICNNGAQTLVNLTATDTVGGGTPVAITGLPTSLGAGQCASYSGSYIPSGIDDGGTNPCTASFHDVVNARAEDGSGNVITADPAVADCPLCPCASGGGDAGTGG